MTGGSVGVVGATATEIAARVRAGDLAPTEVVRAHLEHIRSTDARIGAFRVVRAERAVTEADHLGRRDDLSSLPLAGVPIAVKDNVPVAGEALRHGSVATTDAPSPEDHEVVRRLRAAGAVVVGITTVPELGIWATTEGPGWATRNPWRLDATPGGSSGGSAAAVAAAMVPVAHGNDGLGSIRIPSACCGLVGLKPGRGVVPSDVGSTSWFGLSENGAMATTVRDVAATLSVMAGRPELARVELPAHPLRIAVSVKAPAPGLRVDPEWRRATLETARLLEEAGHHVETADPPYATRHANAMLARWFAGPVLDAEPLERSRLGRRTRRHLAAGRLLLLARAVGNGQRDRWREALAPLFDAHDVLLVPTLASPPLPAEGWHRRSWGANVVANVRFAPFTGAWNLAGYPAASVPAGLHTGGTPLGVQVVAADGGEATILSLLAQLEGLRPWPRHALLAAG